LAQNKKPKRSWLTLWLSPFAFAKRLTSSVSIYFLEFFGFLFFYGVFRAFIGMAYTASAAVPAAGARAPAALFLSDLIHDYRDEYKSYYRCDNDRR